MRGGAPGVDALMLSSPAGRKPVPASRRVRRVSDPAVQAIRLYQILVGLWSEGEVASLAAQATQSEFDAAWRPAAAPDPLAEDHTVNQQLAVSFLRRMGYAADVVSNGFEGRPGRAPSGLRPGADGRRMPELDGLEASRSIGSEHGGRRPEIIAMTANVLQGDRERCARRHGRLRRQADPRPRAASRRSRGARRIYARRGETGPALPLRRRARRLPRPPPTLRRRPAGRSSIPRRSTKLASSSPRKRTRSSAACSRSSTPRPRTWSPPRKAAQSGDASRCASFAHTLKGLSGTVGARRVQALCGQIESNADTRRRRTRSRRWERLEKELDARERPSPPRSERGAG